MGDGFTSEGQFPFLDKINLYTMEKDRLYESRNTHDKWKRQINNLS